MSDLTPKNEQFLQNPHPDVEIDLKEFLTVLWSQKLLIIATTTMFAIGSVLVALWIPNQYKATALLAPAQTEGGTLSSALGQFGSLASLAGVTIGDGYSGESQIAQEIMKSWSFMESFIADNDLAMSVYAVEGWQQGTGELLVDPDIYDVESKQWRLEDDETGVFRAPTSWELFERFSKKLGVSEDRKSGLVTVTIEYYSPQIAKDWLDLYIDTINEHMQARQVAKVTNNIRYLEDQISKTSIAEMREVFYTIIEEQTKNKMAAEASPDYAFVPVSPSMVPEKKSQPQRAVISIVGTLLGGFFAVLMALARHYLPLTVIK